MTLMIPTIHLNGTSRGELLDQLKEAIGAIDAACVALGKATPNGRDYYPQSDGAIVQAQAQHTERRRRLVAVHDELMAIAEAILE
jgi:hypothetical protein